MNSIWFNEDALSQLLAVMVPFLSIVIIISLIVFILMIVSTWKIYKKAGEGGWKCLIPIYNEYILFKIAWKKKFFWISFILSIVMSFLNMLAKGTNIGIFAESPVFSGIVSVLTLAIAIILLVIEIKVVVKLAKSFRKSGGFAVGLILLPVIFYPILAFGSAKYRKGKKRRPVQTELPEAAE